jgi:Mg-chelatase subunit ChlD
MSQTRSASRQQPHTAPELEGFVRGLLPAHLSETVTVMAVPGTDGAAVHELDSDQLKATESLDINPSAFAGVDADYVIVVTNSLPDGVDVSAISDGFSPDTLLSQYQHALILHECLHILKTAIIKQEDAIATRVSEAHHDVVSTLTNYCEDGIIERECRTGDAFSSRAAARLDLARQLVSTTVDDLPETPFELTLLDTIKYTLYDELIWRTGISEALFNPDDPRVVFQSDGVAKAISLIEDDIYRLAADLDQLRSDDVEETFRHDKTASVQRALRVAQFWETCVAPLLDDDAGDTADTNQGQQQETAGGDASEDNGQQSASDSPDTDTGSTDENSEMPSLGDDALEEQGDLGLGDEVSDLPDIGSDTAPEPDDVSLPESVDSDVSPVDERDISPSVHGGQVDQTDAQTENNHSEGESPDNSSGEESSLESQSSAHSDDNASQDSSIESDKAGSQSGQQPSSTTQQPLSAFGESQPSQPSADGTQADESQNAPTEQHGSSQPSATDVGEAESPQTSSERAENDSSTNADAESASNGGEQSSPSPGDPADADTPSEMPSSDNTTTDQQTFEPEDFAASSDNQAGERSSADGPGEPESATDHSESPKQECKETAVPDTFQDIIDDNPEIPLTLAEQEFNEVQEAGANSGNLDQLNTPSRSSYERSITFGPFAENARLVSDTLAHELTLENQDSTMTGYTNGRFDAKHAWRLSMGDTSVFSAAVPGGEKQYHIVLILDRSGSMRGANIEGATESVTTFAHAAEQVGINVSVIDFVDNTARFVKPAVIPTREVAPALLSRATGGGTPLSDALSMARTLTHIKREQPIIITLTDGKPEEVDDVIDEMNEAHAPVCSITLAMDKSEGNLPSKAERLQPKFLRSTAVHDEDTLIKKLDSFAALLGAI